MFKQDLIKEILKDKTLDKDLVIVANTYQNISNEELIKKLELLNASVNKKLFRYFQKYIAHLLFSELHLNNFKLDFLKFLF